MKLRTRWKRVKNINILNKRFFDYSEYGLCYFTIKKAYKCKEYCKTAETPTGSQWFDKHMVIVKTDTGLTYKIPFCPWHKIYDESGQKSLSDYYNECPW